MTAAHCHATLTPLAANASEGPDAVLFTSRGAVLVIGDDAGIADAVNAVASRLRTTVCAPSAGSIGFARQITALDGRVSAVRGRFGAFRAEVEGVSGPIDIGAASANRDGLFDMVLDLGRRALIQSAVPPIGYFAPGPGAEALAAAIAAMRSMVGRFTKPRYFSYEPGICAHGASGVTGCTRCLDVCSAEAIVSAGEQVRVDPYLCQGCAACTLACPTGALSFRLPTAVELRQQMRLVLQPAPASILVVHTKALATTVRAAIGVRAALPMTVDPLPAFGEELWFEAFALGAAAVALIDDEKLVPASRALVETHIAQSRTILQALRIAPDRLQLLRAGALTSWLDSLAAVARENSPIRAAPVAPFTPQSRDTRTKRLSLLDAISTLGDGGAAFTPVPLPPDAYFGGVSVDRNHCTLCFACTNLCPTGALTADNEGFPRLRFVENACIQCGLCERGCPEKAVTLQPRFIPLPGARLESTVLQQDELFPCTACGTPFINRRLLASSLERVKDHPVLAQGGRERLMTCPACRQTAMLQV